MSSIDTSGPGSFSIGLPRRPGLAWAAALGDALSGLALLDRLYRRRPAQLSPQAFIRFALEQLQLSQALEAGTLDNVPASGPVIVVANHPYGAAEGLLIADLLLQRRPDLRLLANSLLMRVPEVAPLITPIDVFRGGVNFRGLREAQKHLATGGALLVFPAGEVSRLRWSERAVIDPPWTEVAAVLAARSRARVLPLFVGGQPQWRSVLAGALHTRLRTLLLARDLLRLRGRRVPLRLGSVVEPAELERMPAEARTPYLRMLTYALAHPAGSAVAPRRALAPLAPAQRPEALAAAVARLATRRLFAQGEFEVYAARGDEHPELLQEIGRLREKSFRLVDEGTGQSRDLDGFDAHYHHLFAWHRARREIIGAYRLGYSDEILPRLGPAGLYTHTLFAYDARLFARTGPALELGRSFVSPEWQRSFHPLRLLWAGIAAILAARPQLRCLFGPVSISPSYSGVGRRLIADTLSLHHSDAELQSLVRPRNPPEFRRAPEDYRNVVSALADTRLLSRAVSRLERGAALPVLIRHYLELNGRFAGFNVDEAFNGTLDGLVFVDVARIPARTLSRYSAPSAQDVAD